MRIAKSIEIEAPAERVWRIIGEEFDRVGEWATPVPHSAAAARQPINADAPVAGRTCETSVAGFPSLNETLTAYDDAQRTLAFEIVEGMPGFVSEARNEWRIDELGPNRTQVTLDGRIETRGVGRIMAPIMRFQLNRAIDQTVEDLQVYAATGEVSARKRRSLEKHGEPAPTPAGA